MSMDVIQLSEDCTKGHAFLLYVRCMYITHPEALNYNIIVDLTSSCVSVMLKGYHKTLTKTRSFS